MKLAYVEVGQIVNTHGVRGELKVQPWCDSAEQFLDFQTLYLDGNSVHPTAVRIHKNNVLLTLPGVEDMDTALHLKNKILSVRREDIHLPEGRYLNAELSDWLCATPKTDRKSAKLQTSFSTRQ